LRWLETESIDLELLQPFADEWTNKGATVIGLAVNLHIVAVFALQDTLKPAARRVISKLRNPDYQSDGYRIYLVSGDSSRTVHAIASKLDIPSKYVFAEIRPEQKAEFVKRLQTQGERVAFVGDGINDAPALSTATVGVAFGPNNDVASGAADAVILSPSIGKIDELIHIGDRMRRIALQSAVGGIGASLIGMAAAAGGHLSPVQGAVIQELIDLVAVLNAVRAAWPPGRLTDY
jgi:P-type E1-E2 ATPase